LHHDYTGSETRTVQTGDVPSGRWPANVCLDEDAAALFPESRFFYTAKASRREREAGLDGMTLRISAVSGGAQASVNRGEEYGEGSIGMNRTKRTTNHHPTVKPIALMRWLCRLVTPPNGLVLDPFNGSGSTGCAAVLEGFRYLGAELDAEYVEIARKRIAHWASQTPEPDLFG
jgi:site-specific DNA-methyltransferase (adenine-specific)